jgi:demethylmenaquinone methyltransferase/2-methoxy-6-polyprenyl-1,4-benzoquinol methylase
MLERAGPKLERAGVAGRTSVLCADALRLPFPDGGFDGVTVAFGVRNLVDPGAGFREIRRVLRPGGRLVVLEFSQPGGWPLAGMYRLYLNRLLPAVGDRVAGREGPYRYLARTIGAFPPPDILAGSIREAGFAAVGWRVLTSGIVALHSAWKST